MIMRKLVVIDDHDTFRVSLRQIVGQCSNLTIAEEASDARQGGGSRTQTPSRYSDDWMIDLSLPDRSGIQLTRLLRTTVPETRIIIVSMHSKIDYLIAALRAGALGYIVKESVSASLCNALEAALRNEYYLDPALSQEIAPRLIEAAEIPELSSASEYGNLTVREQEILRLLAKGERTGQQGYRCPPMHQRQDGQQPPHQYFRETRSP